MKVLMPDMHSEIPKSFANAFKAIGITMVMCDNTFPISYGRKWTKDEVKSLGDNVECYSWSEFLQNPTDVVSVMCAEQQQDMLTKVLPNTSGKSKLIFYSGNDDMYRFYSEPHVKNILAVDESTYNYYKAKDVNCLQYFPWIDYDKFKFSHSDNKVINCYTSNLEKLFPESYKISKEIVEKIPNVEFNYFGAGYRYLNKDELVEEVQKSGLTNTIKRIEGYGYNIIESMAMGRPCIHYKPFTKNRTFTKWLNSDTGIIFKNQQDYLEKTSKYFSDKDFRYNMQEKASESVRKIINNEEQNEKLKKFFERLS